MGDSATQTRISRRRPRWTLVALAVAAALVLAGLLEIVVSLMVADGVPAGRDVGHPNTRALVLPLLPRP
jgi:hypothetical protein